MRTPLLEERSECWGTNMDSVLASAGRQLWQGPCTPVSREGRCQQPHLMDVEGEAWRGEEVKSHGTLKGTRRGRSHTSRPRDGRPGHSTPKLSLPLSPPPAPGQVWERTPLVLTLLPSYPPRSFWGAEGLPVSQDTRPKASRGQGRPLRKWEPGEWRETQQNHISTLLAFALTTPLPGALSPESCVARLLPTEWGFPLNLSVIGLS